MKLKPLRQSTTPDDVYVVLRKAILDGGLTAGSQLREAHIAADLGISRAPVREAFRRLEEEGLVVKIPFRGAFVAELTPQTIAEILALRSVVEPYAAEQALETLRGPRRQQLERAVEALKKASHQKNVAGTIDGHLRFHRLFYEYSGNGMLLDLWNTWESRLRLYLVAEHHLYENLVDLEGPHEELATIVLEGNVRQVRKAIVDHLRSARLAYLDDGSKSDLSGPTAGS
jgi:DNA-binding GntR family transcriptional regulator